MKIIFIASELTPLAKVGGLGDVVGSLPKALAKLGANASVVIPRYEQINLKKIKAKVVIKNFPIRLGKNTEHINLYKTRMPSGVTLYLIENKRYLSQGPIYFEKTAFVGSFKEIQRFLLFSKTVYELLASRHLNADTIHCNDWHAGALVSLIKRGCSDVASSSTRTTKRSLDSTLPSAKAIADKRNDSPRIVFTIHNLANQGVWNKKEVSRWFGPNNFKIRGKIFNFMAEGIENSDIVTTVSPTYAKEIQTKQYGGGLQKLLKKRAEKKKLVGILNGIDYGFWPNIARSKKGFQKKMGLEISGKSPIFGMVARLTYQKGVNLLTPIVPKLIKKYGAQFVFLGQGETKNEVALEKLARKYPENVFVKIGFDGKLARDIYAQSDFFFMPSLFEPCGLGQMIAMHYGTVPIVRKTGGLKDSVINKKTGFVFEKPTPRSLLVAAEEAAKLHAQPKKFSTMIKNCKKQDFSWKKSAGKYLETYE